MDALPLGIVLRGARCLCIGGGSVAARRVPALLAAGAAVTIIAPTLEPSLRALIERGACAHHARPYQAGDCAGAFLVLVATGDNAVDAAAADEARSTAALVCVASDPGRGNCLFMATIQRGSLVVALHGGGAAPAVTSAVRRQLEATLPERLGDSLDRVAELRRWLRTAVPDPGERGRRWRLAVESGVLDAVIDQGTEEGFATLERILLGADGQA